MRGDYGRCWFAANWGYAAKHSLVLREYLRPSGQRSEQQLHDYADNVLARNWTAPYDDPPVGLEYPVRRRQVRVCLPGTIGPRRRSSP